MEKATANQMATLSILMTRVCELTGIAYTNDMGVLLTALYVNGHMTDEEMKQAWRLTTKVS